MEKYKVLKDFTTFEHQYKTGEIYYIDKQTGNGFGIALVYIDNQENSEIVDRLNKKYYYCLQHIEDICEQSKALKIGKIYRYKDLCIILNEVNMGYNYLGKRRVAQQEKWKRYFNWEHTDKRFMYKITEIYDNSESLLEKTNSFVENVKYLNDVAGVYILKFKDKLPYIGQSTNLQERLTTHRDKYGDFEFEILEKITNNNINSKYILSTALIYLEGKYINNYGLRNLQNKVNSYNDCCDIANETNIYGFMSAKDKNITYNLFKKLESLNNDIGLFIEECKTYNMSDIKNLSYYKNDIKIEKFKNTLSQLYGVDLTNCNKWFKEIDEILINFFKEKRCDDEK